LLRPPEAFAASIERYLRPTLQRAYRFGRRWDEGLWRVLELSAVDMLLPQPPQEPVLDVGCGNGDVFEMIFGRQVEAYGVDCSPAAIASAESSRRYRRAVLGDARAMSFADGFFGTVFSNSVLEHIEGVDRVLTEARRVLAPGGRLLFTTPDPLLRDHRHYYWRRRLSPFGLDLIGRALARREDALYQHVSIRSFAEWEQALRRAGFESVERYQYCPESCALLMSKFSGAVRAPRLLRLLTLLQVDPSFRQTYRDVCEQEWVEYYARLLRRVLRACEPHEQGCGQVIMAVRPSRLQ
jgi:ubiquinone/menaquinone biosynthesis C-methylase UbiE